LESPHWVSPHFGYHRSAQLNDPIRQRILDATAVMPDGGVVGGWASAYLQGVAYLDGGCNSTTDPGNARFTFDANTVSAVCTPETERHIIDASPDSPILANPLKSSHRSRPTQFVKPLVLCIADTALYLNLRRAVLEAGGYEVIGVTSTADAMTVLRVAPISCVIADHMLHGKTGLELSQEMKKLKPKVPIILHSGTVPKTSSGVDVYVHNGEPAVTFLNVVRDVIERFWS
jgi:CheY-like chemotaxis protein